MAITPAIREFLVRLDALVEAADAPGLDRAGVTTTSGDAVALVRLPYRASADAPAGTELPAAVEIQVDDRVVVVSYGGEPLHLHDRAFALRFVEALLAGRVEIEVRHGPLWRTTRSYLDGAPRPFLVTRMPVPSLRPRIERRRVGFARD